MNKVKYILNGEEVTAKEFLKDSKGIAFGEETDVPPTKGWPFYSTNARVHPKMIPQAIEEAKKRGVRVEFNEKGFPKFESARHQTEYLRVRGLYNMDGGYAETIPNVHKWD